MYCGQCGKYRESDAQFCSGCGMKFNQDGTSSDSAYGSGTSTGTYMGENQSGDSRGFGGYRTAAPMDRGGFWWGFLGFILSGSFIGLILFLIWRDQYPKRAKAIIKGVIVGWVISIIVTIFFFSYVQNILQDVLNDLE
jgi:ABC-type Fe3+-siderophore transport system permease subunit